MLCFVSLTTIFLKKELYIFFLFLCVYRQDSKEGISKYLFLKGNITWRTRCLQFYALSVLWHILFCLETFWHPLKYVETPRHH